MDKNASIARVNVKIETAVFQTLIAFLLTKIQGVSLPSVGLIDTLFGRSNIEKLKFIEVVRNDEANQVDFTITLNIGFGGKIPEKALEIQQKICDEIHQTTGYQVNSVSVIFQSIVEKVEEDIKQPFQLSYSNYRDHT